jgi:hypothetical protein
MQIYEYLFLYSPLQLRHTDIQYRQNIVLKQELQPVFRIRIRNIRMILGLRNPDPDP